MTESLYYDKIIAEAEHYDVPVEVSRKYIDSLVKHIGYVREAAQTLHVPNGQIMSHDDSKWSMAEFPGYALHFQGGGDPIRFSRAWLHHIHHNPHHWQSWIFPDGFTPKDANVEPGGLVPMPEWYALEMVADWLGATKAYTGEWDLTDWLNSNLANGKIKLHSATQRFVRTILYRIGYDEIDNFPLLALDKDRSPFHKSAVIDG